MPIITLETRIRCDLETCFDLSRSIDLHQVSTAHTKEKAVSGRMKGLIELNESVTWEAFHFGIKQQLTSTITAFERPFHFRDEQAKGIFSYYIHDHFFREEDGFVIMKDIFEYGSPGGIVGRIFNYIILTPYLKRLLQKRNHVIKEYAETGKWRSILKEGFK